LHAWGAVRPANCYRCYLVQLAAVPRLGAISSTAVEGQYRGWVRDDINQRVYELSIEHRSPFEPEFLCECGDPDCLAFVKLPVRDYERARAAGRLITAPGHPLSRST